MYVTKGTWRVSRWKFSDKVTVKQQSSLKTIHALTLTRHRWTGKWEAHLWDAAAPRKNPGSGGRARGRQVYLGGYATEEAAARAYDRAALAYWGEEATLNVSVRVLYLWFMIVAC
jgi:hypothetical protein